MMIQKADTLYNRWLCGAPCMFVPARKDDCLGFMAWAVVDSLPDGSTFGPPGVLVLHGRRLELVMKSRGLV